MFRFRYLFLFILPGMRLIPKFKVTVSYNTGVSTCRTMSVGSRKKNDIPVRCVHELIGRSVKITSLASGRLNLCEVEIYGKYG